MAREPGLYVKCRNWRVATFLCIHLRAIASHVLQLREEWRIGAFPLPNSADLYEGVRFLSLPAVGPERRGPSSPPTWVRDLKIRSVHGVPGQRCNRPRTRTRRGPATVRTLAAFTVPRLHKGSQHWSPYLVSVEELMTLSVPECISPLRWRWMLFLTRRQEVRFVYWPPYQTTGLRRIRMYDRSGYDIGMLVWVVCDACHVGSINKISISPEYQRQGIGRRLIRRALADGPGYRWQTTGQSPEAKRFFPVLGEEVGFVFAEYGGVCEHLSSRHGHRSAADRRRLRPVLLHDV